MKIHEYFYILAVLIFILSFLLYFFSTTFYSSPGQDAVSNIFGNSTDVDSLVDASEALPGIQEEMQQRRTTFMWIGIAFGVVIFIAGLIIKRKIDGPDQFIDDEPDEDDEDSSTGFF